MFTCLAHSPRDWWRMMSGQNWWLLSSSSFTIMKTTSDDKIAEQVSLLLYDRLQRCLFAFSCNNIRFGLGFCFLVRTYCIISYTIQEYWKGFDACARHCLHVIQYVRTKEGRTHSLDRGCLIVRELQWKTTQHAQQRRIIVCVPKNTKHSRRHHWPDWHSAWPWTLFWVYCHFHLSFYVAIERSKYNRYYQQRSCLP